MKLVFCGMFQSLFSDKTRVRPVKRGLCLVTSRMPDAFLERTCGYIGLHWPLLSREIVLFCYWKLGLQQHCSQQMIVFLGVGETKRGLWMIWIQPRVGARAFAQLVPSQRMMKHLSFVVVVDVHTSGGLMRNPLTFSDPSLTSTDSGVQIVSFFQCPFYVHFVLQKIMKRKVLYLPLCRSHPHKRRTTAFEMYKIDSK